MTTHLHVQGLCEVGWFDRHVEQRLGMLDDRLWFGTGATGPLRSVSLHARRFSSALLLS